MLRYSEAKSMQYACVYVVVYPEAFLCSASITDLSQSAR